MFLIKKNDGESVTLGNNVKSKIKCIDIVSKMYSPKTDHVQYVEGFKLNLLIISQQSEITFKLFSNLTCMK